MTCDRCATPHATAEPPFNFPLFLMLTATWLFAVLCAAALAQEDGVDPVPEFTSTEQTPTHPWSVREAVFFVNGLNC